MDNAAPNQAVPEASDVRAPLPPSQPSSLLQAASRLFAWLKRPVLVAAELPDYRGPHAVGCYDFEWHPPAGHSAFRMGDVEEEGPKGEPLKPHSTVLVRLYYPCSSDASHARASWLPDPLYGKGYGDFLRFPRFVSSLILNGSGIGAAFKPALANAPLWQPNGAASTLPVVIFSHGLGGCRTTYSALCGDLASFGMLVFAIEHRDGSASTTQIAGKMDNWMSYQRPTSQKVDVTYGLRSTQLKFRVKEVMATLDVLQHLNSGNAPRNVLDDSSQPRPSTFSLSSLKSRLKLCDSEGNGLVFVAGHSFGGATALLSLADVPKSFAGGLILDPWMFPLPKPLNITSIRSPTLIINSEQFSKWSENFAALTAFIRNEENMQKQNSDVCNSVRLATILGTGHQNQSDFPVLMHPLGNKIKRLSYPKDPKLALLLNQRMMLAFIRQRLINLRIPSEIEEDKEIFDYGAAALKEHIEWFSEQVDK